MSYRQQEENEHQQFEELHMQTQQIEEVKMIPLNEIAAALAKAQMEIENASKDAKNPFYGSKYADLATVLNVVRPVFSKNGIAIVQMPSTEGENVTVTTVLIHSSGQSIQSSISAPGGKIEKGAVKFDPQTIGSAITYLRRYALSAMAGIAQEDDDGNAAAAGVVRQGYDKAAAATKPKADKPIGVDVNTVAKPALTVEAFQKNLPAWTKGIEGGKLPADLVSMLSSKYTLAQAQIDMIMAIGSAPAEQVTDDLPY